MKTTTAIASLLLAGTIASQAELVTIANHDFELPVTTDGSINNATPTNWTSTVASADGVFNPNGASQLHYGTGLAGTGTIGTMDGPSLGFFFLSSATNGSFSQTLATTLAADTRYSLTFSVGQRANFNVDQISKDFVISLRTATTDTVVATFTGDRKNTNGASPLNTTGAIDQTLATFVDYSATATTGAAPIGLGEALVVRIESTGDGRYLDFDNARLDVTAVLKSINVNFGIALNDANAVDAGESSIVGITGTIPVDGSIWNNVNLRSSGKGDPTSFTSATQSGSHIDLNDSSGTDAGVDMTSSGSFYSNFGNSSFPNQTSTGDAGLLQSFINLNSSESISLSGLATWAPNGYKVYAVFDIGAVTRTYAVTMNDGSTSQAFWTADTSGTDADTNNDGVIGWIQTSATTSGTAVTDANHAVFGTFTGDTLTISGDAVSGRATLSGFQIVALSEPPATINSFTATPTSFQAGETVTLNWDVSDADSVTIDQGVGTVSATGSTALTPSATTTWTLTATRGATATTSQVTATLSKGPIDVYLLSGQSNMQGIALTSNLPNDLLSIPEIMLYASGSGVSGSIVNQWVTLQPANGSQFGPEIAFGDQLRDLCPGRPIALIKFAASGNSLEIDFKPGANASDTANWGLSFTGMVNTFNNGIAALEADGWQPVIHGMCWQQGEQDAKDGLNVAESNTSADDYGANLDHFIDRVREQFAAHASTSGIRFVLGQVLPYAPAGGDVEARFPGRDLVRQAELDLDENSGAALAKTNTATVPTNSIDHPTLENVIDGYRDTDEVHLGATAQLALGKSMAYKMLELSPQSYADWSSGHSLTGGQADDDDNDGVDNLGEFYLGTDPNNGTSVTRLTPGVETIDGMDYLTLSFPRNLNALDFQGIAQVSEDLTNWNNGTVPVFIESVKNNGGTATIKYRAPWDLSDISHPRIFLRIQAGPLNAQVHTEPVGTVKITCPGSAVTTISASLRGSTEYQGSAASIAAGTISTGVTSWSAAQWTTEPHLCYIENAAGAEEAHLITAMDETTGVLTLATDHDLTARYPATPTYRICKAVTLGDFFANISASFETSDRVYLWNGSGWDSYVYFSFWRKVGDLAPNRDNTVLMPNLGIYILRGAATELVITHSGAVPMLDQVSTITGTSFISNRFPIGTTLGTSGIHDDANWNANDRIYLWNGSGWDAYYYSTHWRLSTDAQTDADGTVINPESAIFIVRDAAVAADSAGVTHPNPYTP